jgi:type II secretory pathway component PulM
LKRFEQPDPGFETRCLDATMRRIRNLDAEPVAGRKLWDWFTMPQPALRYGMAAVVALLVGVNVYLGSRTPEQPAAETVDSSVSTVVSAPVVAPVAPAVQALAAAAPTSAVSPSQDVFLVASSNRQNGGGVQYGPGASVPVGFDF